MEAGTQRYQQQDPTGHDHHTTDSRNAGRRKDSPAQEHQHAEKAEGKKEGQKAGKKVHQESCRS
jgi:hypothetical protein|tara:strand:- start:886 stop:1077 length:192 start_codon:yes stop_codon:yes gene_type:complete